MNNIRKQYPRIPREYPKAKFTPEKKAGSESSLAAKQSLNRRAAAQSKPDDTPDSISAADYDKLTDSGEKWKILVKALRRNRRRLLRIPGVTAVDLGYKIVNGSFTDKLALRVHVERKLPDDSWKSTFKDRPCDFIPNSREELPPEQGCLKLKDYDVPLDVIEADYKPVQLAELPRPRMVLEKPHEPEEFDRRRRLDPLVGGISIGSPNVPAGTLGALVWDNRDGSVCILSNWHVLSGNLFAEIGTPCFQPGRFDQGNSNDVVARLKRWSFDNQTDAALAELNGSRHYCAGEIVSMFQQISGVADPYLGMIVRKSGRSTGHTWGFVDGLYFSSALRYSDGIVQVFEDQIHIAPADPDVQISEAGDSGSVWVTEINGEGYRAVGLHFAGDLPHSAFGEYALANPMSIVRDRLEFSFRPLFLEIRDEAVLSPPPPAFLQVVQPSSNGNGIHPDGLIPGGTLTRTAGQGDPSPVTPTG